MHCVPQHFVSVHYSFPREFKWPHSSFSETQCTTHAQVDKLQRLQTRTRLASTASSSAVLYKQIAPKAFTMRRDALRRSQIHRPNCASQELSPLTPFTWNGHP